MVKIKVKKTKTKDKVKLKQKTGENDLSKMSVDDFFENGLETEDTVENEEEHVEKPKLKKVKDKKIKKSKKNKVKNLDDTEDNVTDDAKIHKKQLSNLKEIDPEFYQFLEKNDKNLLKFNLGDADDDDSDNEAADDDENDDLVHKPTGDLEVPSDEEDFEGDDDDDNKETAEVPDTITLKTLKLWQTDLQSDKVKLDTIKLVIKAFGSALASITTDNNEGGQLRVEGAAIFNGVIQLCVLHLQPALNRFLGILPDSKKMPDKTKKWKRVRNSLKRYIGDITKLIENISSGNITTVLLKHIHAMSKYLALFVASVVKPLLKRLVTLWSTSSEETVRIISFLCILRLVRAQQQKYLAIVLKAMYMAYVRNSKFVSPTTLPGINFMRRSLIEMFALDLNVSYQHSFLYIRQLAIHLRNAVTLNKKDAYQSVYNWQYLNSLRLWADLLSFTYNKQQLQPLIYPLVSIITGCIKLIPTAQYFPLRFHCVKILIKLSKETNIFIPVLPYLLEVFESATFGKKPTELYMKPINFACIFRVNKKEMATNVFRDEVIENIYGLTLEYLANMSNSISYPDIALLGVTSLRKYLKVCKNSKHLRKLKQLADKIDDNSKFIEQHRNKITFALNDQQLINSWEVKIRNGGTPLSIYFESWQKTNVTKQKRMATDSENINDYNLPTINRELYNKKSTKSEGPVDLFPSDDENDMDIGDDNDDDNAEEKVVKKKKSKDQKVKKSKKIVKHDDDEEDDYIDEVDIVKDLDLNDWD